MLKLAAENDEVLVFDRGIISDVEVHKSAPVQFERFAEVFQAWTTHLVAADKQLLDFAGRSEAADQASQVIVA